MTHIVTSTTIFVNGQKSPKKIVLQANPSLPSLTVQNAVYKRNLCDVAKGLHVEDGDIILSNKQMIVLFS